MNISIAREKKIENRLQPFTFFPIVKAMWRMKPNIQISVDNLPLGMAKVKNIMNLISSNEKEATKRPGSTSKSTRGLLILPLRKGF